MSDHFDQSRLDMLLGLGPQLVADMLTKFLEYVPERLDALDAALAADDVPQMAKEAHAIKSTSGNVGAHALMDFARQIEHAAREGDAAALPGLVPQVRAAFEAARPAALVLVEEHTA